MNFSHKDTKPTSILADDFGHKSIKTRRLVLRKIIMKKGVFWGYFPDNPQDKFYQSEKFKHLLNYLTQNPSQAQLKEKTTRGSK